MILRGAAISFCTLDIPCRKGSDIEVTNPACMSECTPRYLVFLASLHMISGLWGVFHTTVFLVTHFVIMIVNKLIAFFLNIPLLPFLCNVYALL